MEQISSLSTEALYIFTGLFVATVVQTELVSCLHQGNVLPKTCTNADTFRVTFGQSFEVCIEECHRRQRCEIAMFKHGINECSLKDFINIYALKEEEPVCLFANINDWDRTGLSPCHKNSCGLSETCVTSRTSSNRLCKCVKSECPRPPAIKNAKVFSNMQGIGNKNGYTCDPKFIGKGDPFITCTNNGTWTSTNFRCFRIGRKPASDLKIADIKSVDGEIWLEGSNITFECRSGYQGLGINASSLLNSKGEWEPNVVQCCNENITDFVWGNTCIATFNGSLVTTFEAMRNFCKDKGGDLKRVRPPLANLVFQREGYLCLMDGRKKEDYREYLRECLTFHNVTEVLENFSNLEYANLVGKVVSMNLKGHWQCNIARRWEPNEPDGGETEECVVYKNGTHGIYDVDCSDHVGRPNTGFLCDYSLPRI